MVLSYTVLCKIYQISKYVQVHDMMKKRNQNLNCLNHELPIFSVFKTNTEGNGKKIWVYENDVTCTKSWGFMIQ